MMYRVLVTGSRTWQDEWRLRVILDHFRKGFLDMDDDMTLIHGACPKGVDEMADRWARDRGVLVERYPAKWRRPDGSVDKQAGFSRNRRMVDTHPAACLAFIHNNSAGATHCSNLANSRGIVTTIFREENPDA